MLNPARHRVVVGFFKLLLPHHASGVGGNGNHRRFAFQQRVDQRPGDYGPAGACDADNDGVGYHGINPSKGSATASMVNPSNCVEMYLLKANALPILAGSPDLTMLFS